MAGFFSRKRAESAEEAAKNRIIEYKRVFGSPDGREVLFDLMSKYHVLNEHMGDAYAEGQRSVVLTIIKNCRINLEEFDKLLRGETA